MLRPRRLTTCYPTGGYLAEFQVFHVSLGGISPPYRRLFPCSTSHKLMIGNYSSCASGQEIQAQVGISANAATRQIDCPGAAESHSSVNYAATFSALFLYPFSPFQLGKSTSPQLGYRSPTMPLCVKCSKSALLQTRWEKLQPAADEPKVVHSWIKADSAADCALCSLVESEIRAVGHFEQEVTTLMLVSRSPGCFPESSADQTGDSSNCISS